MDNCIICFEASDDENSRITTISKEWSEQHIPEIIEKHLWWWQWSSPSNGDIRWICCQCWQEISSFHNFFLKVELIHKQYNQLLSQSQTDYVANDSPIIKQEVEIVDITDSTLGVNASLLVEKSECINESSGRNNNHEDHELKNESEESEEEENIIPRENCLKRRDVKQTVAEINELYQELQYKFECSLCNIPLSSFPDLRLHYKNQHNLRGYAMCCSKRFREECLLIDHLRVHKDPNFFKCDACKRVYSTRYNHNLHLIKNRCIRSYNCKKCGKKFLKLSNLKEHKLSHLAPSLEASNRIEEKFQCNYCERKYPTEYALRRHVDYSHTGKDDKTCISCGRTFAQNSTLRRHIRQNCHGNVTNSDNIADSSLMKPKVSDILIISSSTSEINTDEENRTNVKEEIDRDSPVFYDSDMVEVTYELASDLCDDEEKYDNVIQNVCTKPLDNKEDECVDNHTNDKIQNGNIHSDNVEEIKAVKDKNTKRKKKNLLSDEFFKDMQYEMQCSICKIIRRDFFTLMLHYRNEHNIDGYAMCCSKKFYRPCLLADHLRVHKDPDYFKCKTCEKLFVVRRGLESHMMTHKFIEPKYNCDECDKNFLKLNELEHHKFLHLKNERKKNNQNSSSKQLGLEGRVLTTLN